MKGTFFEMARIKITHSINHNGRDYVEKVVNQTLLGNCMYFNERNISSYSSGKYHDDQYGNYLLLNTFDKDTLEKIENGNINGLNVFVRVYEDKTRKKVIESDSCAFCKASKAYTISWGKKIKVALQSLFPISTSLAIACGSKLGISNDSQLYESVGISTFTENNGYGGIDIFPIKRVNVEEFSADMKLLLEIALDYSSGLYLNTSKQKEDNNYNHLNAFEESTEWRDAEEFKGKIAAKQNCIYTLASKPGVDGKCKVYVGEAVVSGNRLKVFTISTGEKCIDHTKEEAEKHQFTRFRVDRLKEDARVFLHDAQDSIIGGLMMVKQECRNGYVMTNKQLSKSISTAYDIDSQKRL